MFLVKEKIAAAAAAKGKPTKPVAAPVAKAAQPAADLIWMYEKEYCSV